MYPYGFTQQMLAKLVHLFTGVIQDPDLFIYMLIQDPDLFI